MPNRTLADIIAGISNKPIYAPVAGNKPLTPEQLKAGLVEASKRIPAVRPSKAQRVTVPDAAPVNTFDTDVAEPKADPSFRGVAAGTYSQPEDMGPATPEQQSALSRLFSHIIGDSEADKEAGIAAPTRPQGIFGKAREFMQEPRQPVNPQQKITAMGGGTTHLDRLYKGFTTAETGGLKDGFIRTMSQPKNNISTAYGPAQMTGTLASTYRSQYADMFSKAELGYLDRFTQQAKRFAAFDAGAVKDKRFGYGGSGVLTSDADKALYESTTKKIMGDISAKYKNDPLKTMHVWRFGANGKGSDPKYQQKFVTAYNDRGE